MQDARSIQRRVKTNNDRKNRRTKPKSKSYNQNNPTNRSNTTHRITKERYKGRYDDGLQKVANGFTDLKRDEEVLELSGETRRISAESTVSGERSSVQIRPAPPKLFLTKKPFLNI
jgi:hypothetical protein